jgi:4'-phosphopantetheinyl transferase EntD
VRLESPHGLVVIVEGDTRAAFLSAGILAEVGRDDRGAPILPAGWLGSAANKLVHSAALVAPDDGSGARIGLDLEHARPPRQPIERRILTPREQARITDRRDITRCFAIKEAIYKAIDPFVRRYVGFLEVELGDDLCHVTTELPFRIEITCRRSSIRSTASAASTSRCFCSRSSPGCFPWPVVKPP